jgi:hypothetical protein
MPNPETIAGFEFKTEPVPGTPGKERLQSVHGPLVSKRKNVVRDNDVAPLGFKSASEVQTGYDRGHVVSLGLGGPDHPKNLVPMLAFFNRQVYKEVETLLKLEVVKKSTYIRVLIEYASDPWWMPRKFTIFRHHGDPQAAPDPIELTHQILPRQKYTILQDIYAFITKYDTPDADWCRRENGTLAYAFFETDAGSRELGFTSISDYAPGKFSRLQRDCVWSLNCYNNNAKAQTGWLVSDVKDDTYSDLNPVGCLDFPEVDHIAPFSRGGTNSFWNAQLTSAYYNRSKSATATSGGDQAPLRKQQERDVKKRRVTNT